jgi:hypothetical protein
MASVTFIPTLLPFFCKFSLNLDAKVLRQNDGSALMKISGLLYFVLEKEFVKVVVLV